jgi:hypothetical protein
MSQDLRKRIHALLDEIGESLKLTRSCGEGSVEGLSNRIEALEAKIAAVKQVHQMTRQPCGRNTECLNAGNLCGGQSWPECNWYQSIEDHTTLTP